MSYLSRLKNLNGQFNELSKPSKPLNKKPETPDQGTLKTIKTPFEGFEGSLNSQIPKISAANQPDLEQAGLTALRLLATELQHPLADLLDWYKADLEDLGEMAIGQAREVVTEYLTNREGYRPATAKTTEQQVKAEAKERQREHGNTAPGRSKNTSGQLTGSDQPEPKTKSEQNRASYEAPVKIAEAVEERRSIQIEDGGLTELEAQQQAELHRDYLSHTMGEAKATGCCHAPTGRYCETGRQLW